MSGPFTVIVAGGGPVGLIAAHALFAAGIHCIVLERRDAVAVDIGASLVLGPQNLRVLHQLGLLDAVAASASELSVQKSFTKDGTQFFESSWPQAVGKNHGSPPIALPRARLIQILYEALPEPAKMNFHLNKTVSQICHKDIHGVVVKCSDGSSYQGEVVMGADGVHSRARQQMRETVLEDNPDASWDPVQPYLCTYRCMWCTFSRTSPSGQAFDTQDTDRSIVYLSGKDRGWIFLYEKLQQLTQENPKYTAEQIDQYAASFADYHITDSVTVKAVFSRRSITGMSNIEEGIVQHWSYKRIVLVGDACHKFTPNAGLGLNTGIQDVVLLCNKLKQVASGASTSKPDADTLSRIFAEYQAERMPAVTPDASLSASLTRLQAWDGWFYYLLARFIIPLRLIKYLLFEVSMSRSIRPGLVLEYISTKEPFQGGQSWEHPIPARPLKDELITELESYSKDLRNIAASI